MRVTDRMIFDGADVRTRSARDRLDRATEVASTGIRVDSALDDPTAASLIARYVSFEKIHGSIAKSNLQAADSLTAADEALTEVVDSLREIQSLAIQMGNDTMSDVDRQAAVERVAAERSRIMTGLNGQFAGKFLFGGGVEDSAPFATDGTYGGGELEQEIETAPGVLEKAALRVDDAVTDAGGGPGLFDTLDGLTNALSANDGAAVRGLLDDIGAVFDRFVEKRSVAGTREAALRGASRVNVMLQDNYQQSRIGLEEADAIAAMSELAFAQRALDAALSASAKGFNLTLLDKLR